MRRLALCLILSAFAAPALAQAPAAAQPAPEKPQAVAALSERDKDAAAALEMSMRHKAEQDARLAAIACQAGDTSKCALAAPAAEQAANPAVAKAPKP
ncbi:MAG: hypothetical protein JSR98_15355 [Proteobacteria bacterium]|nr:hypothetical protein [Pseudomonadota bacterium]